MYDNGSMVRMEKRAVNKVGLILIIIVAVAALGGGIFFLVKNRNNLDFSFPWSKSSKEKQAEAKKKEEKEKIALERQKVDISGAEKCYVDNIEVLPKSIKYDANEGYIINIEVKNRNNLNYEVEFYNITVDEYQIDYYETIKMNRMTTINHTIKINPESLDLYNIETFKKIYVYTRATLLGDEKKDDELKRFNIPNKELGDNTQKPQAVSNIGNADKVKVDYYKKEEDDDFTNIYFLVTNSNKSNRGYYTLYINAYKVNNEILTNNDFKEIVYDDNKKIVILRIPKSKYKTVDTLTISFFAMRNDDVYTTKTTTLEFNK